MNPLHSLYNLNNHTASFLSLYVGASLLNSFFLPPANPTFFPPLSLCNITATPQGRQLLQHDNSLSSAVFYFTHTRLNIERYLHTFTWGIPSTLMW